MSLSLMRLTVPPGMVCRSMLSEAMDQVKHGKIGPSHEQAGLLAREEELLAVARVSGAEIGER